MILASALALSLPALHAAPPTLDALLPAGGRAGTETSVTVAGKAEPWPCQAWCSLPSLAFVPDPEKKGRFTVAIPADTPAAPVVVRLYNDEGASEPRAFVIGSLPEHDEDPAHAHTLANPEPVPAPPLTINGRLAKSEEIDIYRVPLAAGDTLVARVDGYALRSGIDPWLHLYDPDGVQVALGNDNGRNLDPLLVHPIAKTGDHLVAIMAYATPPGSDIRFTGSSKAVYRLTLTTDPAALPAPPPELEIPQLLETPFALDGAIARPGETDRYTFPAKKGQSLLVLVRAEEFGSPLDPILTLADARGKTLRTVDDTGNTTRDAEYLLSVPADGDYTAAVADRFRKGSPRHRYRIEVAEPAPTFTATVDKSAFVFEPSKSVDLKVKFARLHGHDAPLAVEITGLPPGVSFDPPAVPAKSGTLTLTLEAAADAPPSNQPITVRLVETDSQEPASQAASFSFQDDNARGPYLVERLTEIWLTVKPSG